MSENITNNPSAPSQVVAEVTFPKFINNLGIIPTSYKDSMSYYECLAWLCKYLEETVIPTVNQNGQAVEELQNLYIQLNEYVSTYFENLDVQDEINNKLDELVENGTIQSILEDYIEIAPLVINSNENGWYNTGVTASFLKNNNEKLSAICGFTNADKLTEYTGRDSVTEYIENSDNSPKIFIGDTVFGEDYVDIPLAYDISDLKEGNYIDVYDISDNRYTSVVDSIENNRIYVKFDGFYRIPKQTPNNPATPPDGSTVYINRTTKIWGNNTNLIINNDDSYVTGASIFELGYRNFKSNSIDGKGIDIVNMGDKNLSVGLMIRSNNNESYVDNAIRVTDPKVAFDAYKGSNFTKLLRMRDSTGELFYIDNTGRIFCRTDFCLSTIYNNNVRDVLKVTSTGLVLNGSVENLNGTNIYDVSTGSVSTTGTGGNLKLYNNTYGRMWDLGHLILGDFHIWVDKFGKLRIKSSAPESDTDGTVVGEQTAS